MKKSFLKINSLVLLMALALSSTMFVACGDDDVTGCMDSTAENYNADATIAGDCEYASDKFIGDYVGTSACSGEAPLMIAIIDGLSNDTLMFSVTEALSSDENAVNINIPIQGTPVSFPATVAGNVLTVEADLGPLPFPNPLAPGTTIPVNVIATGTQTYDSTDNSTTGPISITVNSAEDLTVPGLGTLPAGTTLDTGSCTISGVKQ